MRSLGTFIGPFSSTILCVLPKEGLVNELNSAGWAIALVNLIGFVLCLREGNSERLGKAWEDTVAQRTACHTHTPSNLKTNSRF
eukprot:symbB.v1.2.003793.t1/scaffold192.1/size616647/4